MFGGVGNDTYYVDSALDGVREDAAPGQDDGGTDVIMSAIDFSLQGLFVENLTLLDGSATTATGNEWNNVVTGNALADQLHGGSGTDTLTGNAGNDTLDGGAGNDRLYGNAGTDSMDGADGSDVYYADSLDLVRDTGAVAGDLDKVMATTSFVELEGDGIETVQISTGALNVAVTGNSGANSHIGNELANALAGLAGNDTLSGNAGNDTLEGGLGRDKVTGGADADTFVLKAGDSPNTSTGYDTLVDFLSGTDRIDLDAIGPSGLDASAYAEVSASGSFTMVANAATSALSDGMHKVAFVADGTNGWLFWNTDADLHTAEEAVLLTGLGRIDQFQWGDLL